MNTFEKIALGVLAVVGGVTMVSLSYDCGQRKAIKTVEEFCVAEISKKDTNSET